MRFALLVVLLGVSLEARADRWTFFYPEEVTSFGCSTYDADLHENGGSGHDVWIAEAHATRKGDKEPKWQMTVGEYPHNIKGLHDAERACSKWVDEARARVMKAHGTK